MVRSVSDKVRPLTRALGRGSRECELAMAMGSENLRLCRRAIRVIAIVALLLGVLDGVQPQTNRPLSAAERTRTKLLEAVAAGKELHGVRPCKLGDETPKITSITTRKVIEQQADGPHENMHLGQS